MSRPGVTLKKMPRQDRIRECSIGDLNISPKKNIDLLSSPIMNDFSLQSQPLYSNNKANAKYETEIIPCRGPRIWNLIPESIISVSSFITVLKKKIKTRKADLFPC